MGVMQEVTNLLFKELNATIANGSLCDGAGEAGIMEGRGINRVLTPEHIDKAEVVIVWGRNIDTTNSHLLPYLEGKKLVVIDPIQTAIFGSLLIIPFTFFFCLWANSAIKGIRPLTLQ